MIRTQHDVQCESVIPKAGDLPDEANQMRLVLDRLSSPSCKNILIFRNRKSVYIHGYPASQEGRFAVVTDVGCGMRWTLIAPLTNGAKADGEVVWS
jgi:hypothetical protein